MGLLDFVSVRRDFLSRRAVIPAYELTATLGYHLDSHRFARQFRKEPISWKKHPVVPNNSREVPWTAAHSFDCAFVRSRILHKRRTARKNNGRLDRRVINRHVPPTCGRASRRFRWFRLVLNRRSGFPEHSGHDHREFDGDLKRGIRGRGLAHQSRESLISWQLSSHGSSFAGRFSWQNLIDPCISETAKQKNNETETADADAPRESTYGSFVDVKAGATGTLAQVRRRALDRRRPTATFKLETIFGPRKVLQTTNDVDSTPYEVHSGLETTPTAEILDAKYARTASVGSLNAVGVESKHSPTKLKKVHVAIGNQQQVVDETFLANLSKILDDPVFGLAGMEEPARTRLMGFIVKRARAVGLLETLNMLRARPSGEHRGAELSAQVALSTPDSITKSIVDNLSPLRPETQTPLAAIDRVPDSEIIDVDGREILKEKSSPDWKKKKQEVRMRRMRQRRLSLIKASNGNSSMKDLIQSTMYLQQRKTLCTVTDKESNGIERGVETGRPDCKVSHAIPQAVIKATQIQEMRHKVSLKKFCGAVDRSHQGSNIVDGRDPAQTGINEWSVPDTDIAAHSGPRENVDQFWRIFKKGKFRTEYAMRELRRFVAETGHSVRSAVALACYYVNQGKLFRGVAYFLEALSLSSDEEGPKHLRQSILRALAFLLLQIKQPRLALNIWVESLDPEASDTPDTESLAFIAICLRRCKDGRWMDYMRASLSETDVLNQKRLLFRVYCLSIMGEFDKVTETLIGCRPQSAFLNVKLLMLMGRIFWTQGRYVESVNCFQLCRRIQGLKGSKRTEIDVSTRTLAYLNILCLVRTEEYSKAASASLRVHKKWKTDWRFLFWLSCIKFSERTQWNKKPWPMESLRKLLRVHFQDPLVLYANARCLFYTKRDSKGAIQLLEQAIAIQPTFAEARFFRASLRTLLGSHKLALRDMQVCCSLYPCRLRCWAMLGYAAVRAHRYQLVRARCSSVLENVTRLKVLQALSAFLNTIQLKRHNSFNWLLITRAWIFHNFGLYTRAFRDYHLLFKRFPTNNYILKALALSCWRSKGQTAVQQLLERHKDLASQSPSTWTIFALSHFRPADPLSYQTSYALAQSGLHLYPTTPLVRYTVALLAYWTKSFEVVITLLGSGMGDAISDTANWTEENTCSGQECFIAAWKGLLGMASVLTGRFVSGTALLESVAVGGFGDSHFHLAFGIIRMITKRCEEARKAFHKAVRLDPNNTELQLTIGSVYFYFKCFTEAFEWFSRAVDSDSGWLRDMALFNRSIALFQMRQYQTALQDVGSLTKDFIYSNSQLVEQHRFRLKMLAKRITSGPVLPD